MFTTLLETISHWTVQIIEAMGYLGIFVTMAIESACIPLPSEVIMPFSGYLVGTGTFGFWEVSLLGALGNVVGSWIAYGVGLWGGRAFILKYGKYILLSQHGLDRTEAWFARHGTSTVFFSRMLPVVRTFISFPAGIARMNLVPFTVYTFLGALPWCMLLTWIGMKLGEYWYTLRTYFYQFDIVVGLGLVVLLGLAIWKIRHSRHTPTPPPSPVTSGAGR